MHPDTSMTVRQFYTRSSIYTKVDITKIGDDKLYYSGSVLKIPDTSMELMDKSIHYIEAKAENHIHIVLK